MHLQASVLMKLCPTFMSTKKECSDVYFFISLITVFLVTQNKKGRIEGGRLPV